MRKYRYSRAGKLALAALAMFAAAAPTASADSTLPVWTCRASAAYVEVDPVLGDERVEPVLANGFPNRAAPDSEQCASSATGVQEVAIPVSEVGAPLVSLEAASASTSIAPQIAPAREQTASADAGVAETVRIELPGLIIDAETVSAEADGRCDANGVPQLTGRSTIVSLNVNGTDIVLPPGTGQELTDIDLLPLVRIRLNQQVRDSEGDEQSLTQRAAHIELLQADPGAEPLARVVLAEAKVDFHGAVCAPAPPPPTCPAGYEAQPGGPPLVCLKTETKTVTVTQSVPTPCGQGTTANAEGVCVVNPVVCPRGTIRDPASNTCVLVRERPCPPGATADPATRVCVVRVVQVRGSGENGRIGSPTGPRATCGRIEMRFVRGRRNVGRAMTSRFGNRTVTRGRLVTCGANPRPIVGARVDVVHILPDGRRLRKTGLRSRSGGKLTLILPMDLRTRRIEYGYRPDLRSSRVTSRVTLRLTVRSRSGRIMR